MAEQGKKQVRIQSKVDTAAKWQENGNYILLKNEIAYEKETGKYKIGDGITPWKDLPFVEFDSSMIGKEGEGEFSEIFNDYENNSALGDYSHTEGEKTSGFSRNAHAEGGQVKSGGRGFKIISCANEENGNGYYIINTTELGGLVVGDRYSVRMASAKYDVGAITNIEALTDGTTKLTVNNYPNIALEAEDANDPASYTVENYLTIVGKPHLGNVDVGFNAHAEGEKTIAQDRDAHAEGRGAKAIGQYAHAEGRDTTAAYAAHAEGRGTKAMGDMSHAEGQNTTTSAMRAHAEGYSTTASGNNSHAEGQGTKATGEDSHAEGLSTTASGFASHTEGELTQATAKDSHAEGYKSIASDFTAHAEGNATQAMSLASHSEGANTRAARYASHAEGVGTTAAGEGSHTEGLNTIADGDYQHVSGKWNAPNDSSLLIVGNGTSQSDRFNALDLDSSNNLNIAGKILPGDYTNLDERYVRNTGDLGPILNYCGELFNVSELPEVADDGDVYSISQLVVSNGLVYTGKVNEIFLCMTEEQMGVYVTGDPDNLIFSCTQAILPEQYYFDDINGVQHGSAEKWVMFYSKTGERRGLIAMGDINGYPMSYDLESALGVSDPNDVVSVIFGARESSQTDWPYGFPDKLDVKSIKTTYCWLNNEWTPIGGNVFNETDSEIGKSGEGQFSEIFNDYENNVAIGDYSHAEGEKNISFSRNAHAEGGQTKAGGKGFKITSCSGPNPDGSGYYTIGSTEIDDIELGVDRYSVRLSTAAYDVGVILEAQKFGNGVTELLVSNYPNIPIEAEDVTNPENYTVENYLTIVGKPHIGNIDIGFNAHSEGEGSVAQDRDAHAEGRNTKAIGQYAHSEGRDTVAAYAAHAEGRGTKAIGNMSHAEGQNTTANGDWSHAEGRGTTANANWTHAEGQNTKAMGTSSHTEGQDTEATGAAAHAEGYSSQAIGISSHAEGHQTISEGTNSHTEGQNTHATNVAAHAEGSATKAFGIGSHAEGQNTEAKADLSHTEGYATKATGTAAHAEGSGAQAIGSATHAEGQDTVAEGYSAHAEGIGSKAQGTGSHAAGLNTIAKGDYQTAIGKFNVEDSTAAFIIGNGNNNSERDNALMVDWNGNMALAGRVIPSDYTNLDERYVRNTGDLGSILNYCGEVSSASELPETADDGDVYSVSQLTVSNGLIYTGKINELFDCMTEEQLGLNITDDPNNIVFTNTKMFLPEGYYAEPFLGEKQCAFYDKTGALLGTIMMGEIYGYPTCYDLERAFGVSDPNAVVTIIFGLREDTTQTAWPHGFPTKLNAKSIKSTYCWMNEGWTPISSNVYNEALENIDKDIEEININLNKKIKDGGDYYTSYIEDEVATIYTKEGVHAIGNTKVKEISGKFSSIFDFYYEDDEGNIKYQIKENLYLGNEEYFIKQDEMATYTYVYNRDDGSYIGAFYFGVPAGDYVTNLHGYYGNDDDIVSIYISAQSEREIEFSEKYFEGLAYTKGTTKYSLVQEGKQADNINNLPTTPSFGIIHEVAGMPVYWNGTAWKEISGTEKIEEVLDAIIAIQENLIGGNN